MIVVGHSMIRLLAIIYKNDRHIYFGSLQYMYKKFIALFITLGATCTSSVLHAADSTGQSHHNSIQNIALLLNHQDFAAAKSQADELVKTLSMDDIISLSREDFIILLNYYGLKSDKEAIATLVNKRVEKYPNENNLCSYSVRQYGYARACTTDSTSSNFLDEVDQGFVFLIMDTKSQKSMETYIRRLIPRAVTLQDKSDL